MSAVAAKGVLPFGWIGSGGGGGGGGGSTGLLYVAGVCGVGDGPVATEATWTPAGDVLVGATLVNLAIVNNNNEINVTSSPYNNFTFDDVTGTIDRTPNTWVAGDTIILFYKPAAT